MPTYRLRAAKLQDDGAPGLPGLDHGINAAGRDEAVAEVKETYTLDQLMNDTDVAWLVDPRGETVWRVEFRES